VAAEGTVTDGPYASPQALAIDPQTPSNLYLDMGGVYKSTDGGGSWSPASTGLGGGTIHSLAIDPQTPTTLYAGTWGIFKSTDGGGTWYEASAGLSRSSVSSLALDPQTPTPPYAGASRCIFTSVNGGGYAGAVNSPAVVLVAL